MRHELSMSGENTDPFQETVDAIQNDRDPRLAGVAPALGEISISARTVLAVKIGEESVRIGQKRVPFSARRDAADYTDYRYRFLKVLTENQSSDPTQPHGELTPRDIWALMGEESKLDKEAMNAIKKWLPALSYYRQPLVVSTGKRGRGSRYSINPSFFLDIQEHGSSEPSPRPTPTPEEVYEIVRHLSQFDFVMREYGAPEMDPELEIILEAMRPDYRQMIAQGQSIQDFRIEALSKLDQLFSDQDYISRYKQSLNKDAPEYGLLRYVYDLTPNERFLVSRLLKARVEPVSTSGQLRLEAVDENGMIIAVLTPKGITEAMGAKEVTLERVQRGEDLQPGAVIFSRDKEEQPQSGEVNLRNERVEELLEVIEAVANDTAATFLTNLKASKRYRLARIQAVFPRLTTNKLMSAKENGVINPVREQPISLEDVIRIIIHSDAYLRNIFTTRKYKDRIEEIIRKVIEENIERVEEELAEQED
jgi:hypothetical protein